MDDLKAKGKNAFFLDFTGKIIIRFSGILVTVILARLLDPSDFGLVALSSVFIGISQVFIEAGLTGSIIQRRRLHPMHYSSVFFLNFFAALLLILLFNLLAPGIGSFYEKNEVSLIIQVSSFSFLLYALSSLHRTKFRKELDYKLLMRAEVSASFLSGLLGISLAVQHLGAWSLVAQSIANGLFLNIMLWGSTPWKPKIGFSWRALKQLWGFGGRTFFISLLDAILSRIEYAVIGKFFTADILGFYYRAKSLDRLIIKNSAGSLVSVMFPVLSKIQNDLPRFQNVVLRTLAIISFLVFMISGMMYVISYEFIIVVFSEKWLPAVQYYELIVLYGFSFPIIALLANVLKSRGKAKDFFRLNLYIKSLVFFNLGTVIVIGIQGYLYGMLIISFVSVALNIRFAAREISLRVWDFAKPIISQMAIAVLVVFAMYQLDIFSGLDRYWHQMVLKILVYLVAYIGISRLFMTIPYRRFMEQFKPLAESLFQKGLKICKRYARC